MTGAIDPASPAITDPYSPQLRTALVLTGIGTGGAYHAGVLRALQEAGVKVDVVAGRGIGVVGALFAAIDGAQRLWDEKGFWRSLAVRSLYGWRTGPRVIAGGLAVSLAVVAVPLVAVALGLIVLPIDFTLKMIGVTSGAGLSGAYLRAAERALAPEALPTWLPRVVLLVLGAAGAALVASASIGRSGRRVRGAFWWRVVQPPLAAADAADHCWRVMWDLVRGATPLKQPAPTDLARRYTDMLAENIGQPGFRELLITVHDLDAHRDLVFAMVEESRRRQLYRRPTTDAADVRRAEVFDLTGVARDYLADAVAAALTVPLASDVQTVTFAPDAYWRGETHRLCDRPDGLIRLLDEVLAIGAEQIVLVSASPESHGPHELRAPRVDGRGRIGEYLQSAEAAVVRDATRMASARVPRMFTIHPVHNPLGPFDFEGGFDDRSDRRQPLGELMSQGYEDAYRQFIEPVVGASGERMGQGVS
ncbi:MAG TPA: hypothetical protein VHU82_01130 [Vicinamibacterales bacterium]|jgi:hypothetical protein|nr:hypothetical protein [Vicinamibacterales bacterium]